MGGISVWQLLIILVIVILLFGTKKLKNLGGDLGSALKSFKSAVNDDEEKSVDDKTSKDAGRVIEGEGEPVESKKNK
ncbi:MAG TPA: twin-arginine translocase TatA/TatE family subunit [Aeromonadales bacterium]|nr:twin-arginine translocase TatA/TatE family subunit [Aeromonadales bacterium]